MIRLEKRELPPLIYHVGTTLTKEQGNVVVEVTETLHCTTSAAMRYIVAFYCDYRKAADLPTNLPSAECILIKRALRESQGNRREAALLLGIGERTLYRKIDKYGITLEPEGTLGRPGMEIVACGRSS